jgi:hypothetical protein
MVSNVPAELPQVNSKVNAKIQSEVFFSIAKKFKLALKQIGK